jgi:uncharacterized DUF497 family protein
MFEWDEVKRLWTIKERGLDFIDATTVFDGRPAIHVPAHAKGEDRILTVAIIGGKSHTVVWAWRGEIRRIISFRRSRNEEEKAYHKLHS